MLGLYFLRGEMGYNWIIFVIPSRFKVDNFMGSDKYLVPEMGRIDQRCPQLLSLPPSLLHQTLTMYWAELCLRLPLTELCGRGKEDSQGSPMAATRELHPLWQHLWKGQSPNTSQDYVLFWLNLPAQRKPEKHWRKLRKLRKGEMDFSLRVINFEAKNSVH